MCGRPPVRPPPHSEEREWLTQRRTKIPGTPDEQTRRTFMANAVVALGGVIGLGLAIPLITSLIPPADANDDRVVAADPRRGGRAARKRRTSRSRSRSAARDERLLRRGATPSSSCGRSRPTKRRCSAKRPGAVRGRREGAVSGRRAWASSCSARSARTSAASTRWNDAIRTSSLCPCHGSDYTELGEHVAGPALRGLDPLPLRDFRAKSQIDVDRVQARTRPHHIVLKVG